MKRFGCFIMCGILLLVGCAGREVHPLCRFREGFAAECAGEYNGVCFSALFEAAPLTEAGVLPLTVTFYAPAALSGTVLARSAEGVTSLSLDGMQVDEGITELARLLDAFPTDGEISGVRTSKEGHTVVNGVDFSAKFLADGTPLEVTGAGIRLQILRWESVDT